MSLATALFSFPAGLPGQIGARNVGGDMRNIQIVKMVAEPRPRLSAGAIHAANWFAEVG